MIPDEKAPAVARPPGAAGASAPAIFASLLVALVVSVGAAALVLAGVGRAPAAEPAATAPVLIGAPAATPRPAAGGAEGRVQVQSASGSAVPTGAGAYRVTFTWSLQGARENDPAVIHFFLGNQFAGEQRGMLDASIFSFSSGTLTLVSQQECSDVGWGAEIVSIRGAPVEGEGIATIPGVDCD
ncbi:MAG: hypothetical protein A3H36_05550 [Chloroflexi bacterium RIFCSPLOWO2_02_FULL_71_16]|nr:MAG: hypothetical protein A3H36_05550 [Chloroflexi bacterium RIFCSPLOWO2_02_FULL_71_16]